MNARSSGLPLVIALAAAGCASGTPLPKWTVSSPSELCNDPALGPEGFCMPATKIETALKEGSFTITHAARSPSGTTAPYKVRLQLSDGTIISAKFKRAPDDFDAFNNSPRREIAAYEMQKLYLEPEQYVVPPTVIHCLPVDRYPGLFPDIQPQEGSRCAVGVLAYWVEGLSSDDVLDEVSWNRDPVYRDNLGNLNVLTILVGHQDSIGDNFYRSTDAPRSHVLSVDNGLAFGAMGANPVQLFSSKWSHARVDAVSARTVARLKKIEAGEFDRFRVVSQLQLKDGSYVTVDPTEPLEPTKGVSKKDGVVQLGLSVEELTDVQVRLAKLLGDIGSGELAEDGTASR